MDTSRAAEHYAAFLTALGLPPSEELWEAATRVTELMSNWVASADAPHPELSTFPAPQPPDWVAVRRIPLYSFCEHHMVPFFGHADVAYLPESTVAGFSGIVRLVDHYCHQPQLQERLTAQIADAIDDALAPGGLMVRVAVRQLCVELRGLGGVQQCVSEATRGTCRTPEGRAQAVGILSTPHHAGEHGHS